MANTRGRNQDNNKRNDRRTGLMEECEVTYVHTHVNPYEGGNGDIDFNVVDLQPVERTIENGVAKPHNRVRINVCQQDHRFLQGVVRTPRIGDHVLVAWLKDNYAIVLGWLPSEEQEPVCRSESDSEHQEFVDKLCPWEAPHMDENGSFFDFPFPKHPDCFKWWPKTRDSIRIFDCPYGHNRAYCDKLTPCTCLDDLQAGTWFKNFSDVSPTLLDLPWRYKFHHHCGSVWWFDESGDWHIQGKVAEDARGWFHHYPLGTMLFQAEPEADTGAQHMVVANADSVVDDDGDEVASRQIYFDTNSYVEILKNGKIKIKVGSNTTIITVGPDSLELSADTVTLNLETLTVNASTAIHFNTPAIYQNGVLIHEEAGA